MKRKKDNTVNINNNNGITITDSISLTFNSNYWINSKILLIATALAGVIGFTFSFLTLFEFPCSREIIYTAEAMVFIVCSVIFMFPSKSRLLLVVIYVLFGYGIYRTRVEFSNGYAEFINIIAAKLHITQPGHAYYRLTEKVDPEQCLTLFLMFLFMIVTTLICYNTIVKPRFITVFSCTFPFIETGLMFGFSPNHTAFSLLIAYWVAVFAMRIAGNQYHSTSGKPVFVRKKNIFVSSGNLRNNVIEDIGIITLVSVFSVFLLSSGFLKIIDAGRPDKVNETRRNIKNAISDFSIEKIANNMADEGEKNPVTEKSQLGNIPKITFNNKTDLVLYVSDKINSNLYLKGFVGSLYENNSWYALSDQTVQENSDLFKSFETTGQYPQYYNVINDSKLFHYYPDRIVNAHMIINSMFKENKYAFTPYSISASENIKPEKDAFFRAENLNTYSFEMYLTPDYYKDMSYIYDHPDISPELSENEKKYRDYVYENYLNLPASDQMKYLSDFYSYIPDYDGTNISDIYKEIRSVLSNSAEYTLEPGRTPSDTELTYYLLTENHKGYCSHFATAAVVLARLSGVPARYAEGYVVIPSDMKQAEVQNSFYKIEIHDSRAHAWAEFYIDGYGWLPFEFTPGYDRGIISAETDFKSDAVQTSVVEIPEEEVTSVITVPVTEAVPSVTEYEDKAPAETEENAVTTEKADKLHSGSESDAHSPDDIEKPVSRSLKVVLLILKILISILVSFLFILAAVMTRHIICIRKRIMSFRCKSNNVSISNVYKYTSVLLAHAGITKGNMLPLEFAEYAEEKAAEKKLCSEGLITELIHLTLKASFSNEEITRDELKQSIKTAYSIADSVYRSKNKYDRTIFKYILNLCR